MSTFRKIMVLGNVGQMPEIKTPRPGLTVARFSVATNDKKMVDGALKDHTQWWQIDALQSKEKGLVTDVIRPWVKAGTKVMIEGVPEQEEWIDKDNVKRRSFKIKIGFPGTTLTLCGDGRGQRDNAGQQQDQIDPETGEITPKANAGNGSKSFTDDEVPF